MRVFRTASSFTSRNIDFPREFRRQSHYKSVVSYVKEAAAHGVPADTKRITKLLSDFSACSGPARPEVRGTGAAGNGPSSPQCSRIPRDGAARFAPAPHRAWAFVRGDREETENRVIQRLHGAVALFRDRGMRINFRVSGTASARHFGGPLPEKTPRAAAVIGRTSSTDYTGSLSTVPWYSRSDRSPDGR